MKSCPNSECESVVEYEETVETCADCGAALVDDLPTWADDAPAGPPWPAWVPKLGLTIAVPFLLFGLGPRVLLPGLSREHLSGEVGDSLRLSVFALGLMPVFSAFWIVEVAALLVAPWRPLRTGGASGRRPLMTATLWLAMALGIVQAIGIAVFLDAHGALAADARLSRVIVVASLVAGMCVFVLAAQLLDQAALGGGFAVLFTAGAWATLLPLIQEVLGVRLTEGHVRSDHPATVTTAVLLGGIATAALLRWRPTDSEGRPRALPLPACGLLPLSWSAAIAPLLDALVRLGLLPESAEIVSGPALDVIAVITAVALAVGLGFVFNWPSRVARFNSEARPRVHRAVALSAGYVLVVAVLHVWLARQDVAFDLFSLVLFIALALDVIAESRAVQRYGELAPAWPEHRLHAVESALRVLEGAGIFGLARSVHQRALWHFFAPFIPVQILVPRAKVDEARTLLEAHFHPSREVDVDAVFS